MTFWETVLGTLVGAAVGDGVNAGVIYCAGHPERGPRNNSRSE